MIIIFLYHALQTICLLAVRLAVADEVLSYNLPVFPSKTPPKNHTVDKLIPRNLWMAVTFIEKEADMNYHLGALFARNKNWHVHVVDNYHKDVFMNETFANTSLLWAYHQINPAAGAAKADIWRYAVLWTYGGMYIDDDSDMMVPLDNMIEPKDELVISTEKNGFNGDVCYIPTYHLSDFTTQKKYEQFQDLKVFQGNTIPNWALAAAPRHPFIARTMENIVEIIKHEYVMEPVMRDLQYAYRWMSVMCATGPYVMTASSREIVLENPPNLVYKVVGSDFHDFGGKWKAVRIRKDPKHYMQQLQKGTIKLLKDYLPEPPVTAEQLLEWEGRAIQAQNGKEIFVMQGGRRRGIPNFDTFLAMNLTMSNVRVITDSKMSTIPLGQPLPKITSRL